MKANLSGPLSRRRLFLGSPAPSAARAPPCAAAPTRRALAGEPGRALRTIGASALRPGAQRGLGQIEITRDLRDGLALVQHQPDGLSLEVVGEAPPRPFLPL